MATSFSPTAKPLSTLAQLIEKLHRIAEDVRDEIFTRYGTDDPSSIRAGEVCDSVQRLEWSLQRSHAPSAGSMNVL
jgi:hypothetical protein